MEDNYKENNLNNFLNTEINQYCSNCGKTINSDQNYCPFCGQIQSHDVKLSKLANNKEEKPKSNKYVILGIFIAVIILISFFFSNTLFGDDKIVYDFIIENASSFKNPSSIQIESGTLCVDKDCAWVRLSATNGFGARSSGRFFIDSDDIMEFDTSFADEIGELDTKKINRMLKSHFGQ